MSLKDLIKKGFITEQVIVPEWGDAVVTIREPMHVHFQRYAKSVANINENEELSDDEKDALLIKAEAKLFITILLDENGKQALQDGDLDDCYGPVHTRLLNKSFDLSKIGKEPIQEAEKK